MAKKKVIDDVNQFLRIKRVHLPNSGPAYQIEIATIAGDKLASRQLIGHPDTLLMTKSKAAEYINPDEAVLSKAVGHAVL